MKKLIASTLALTILATPLISSACFADTAQEPNVHYVQNEDRSEPFKEKKCNSKKTEKIFADIAAGILALTGATAAILKLCENQLPAKFPFLFTKKTQETKENIENEKTSETATEFETAKYENIETVAAEPAFTKNSTTVETAVDSNITKNETIDPATAELNITKNETIDPTTAELNITKNETTETVAVKAKITKNETTDIETVKVKIIQSLAKNNITNINDTKRFSLMKNTTGNVWNSAKDSSPIVLTIAKYAAGGLAAVAVSTLLFLAGHRTQRAFRSFWNKRTETAAKAATATTLRLAADEVKTRLAAEAAAKAAAEEARVAEIAASASEIIPRVTIEAVEKAIAIIEAENAPDNNEENVAPLVRIVRNLINS